MLKRDKKGKFLPTGKIKKTRVFNERYVKREHAYTLDDLENAYLSGVDKGKKIKATESAIESFKAWFSLVFKKS